MKTEDIKVGETYWVWLIENGEECPEQYEIISKKVSDSHYSFNGNNHFEVIIKNNDKEIKIFTGVEDISDAQAHDLYHYDMYFDYYNTEKFFNTEEEAIYKWYYWYNLTT